MAKKNKEIDITKTGPIGYKALQEANKSSYTNTDEEISTLMNNIVGAGSQSNPYKDITQSVQSKLANTTTPWGSSTFDASYANQEEFEDVSDIRAENQPWYSKIGAGVAKGAILAGTTFLDGTVGTIVGAANVINEGEFNAFWDNPFAKAMKEVTDWSEEVLPNYYTEEEQRNNANGEWYKNLFTANWLGNSFLKNIGFSVGAFYTGKLVTSALKSATPFVKSMVGSTISAINEGKIEALHSSEEWYNYEKAKLDDTYNKQLKSLEVYTNEPEIYNSLLEATNKQYETGLAKLNEDRAKVGNVDLIMNIPILMASNMYMWGKLYAGGANTAIKGMNIAKRNGKYVSESTPVKALTGFLSEGTEEISQKAAATIPGLKYGSELEEFYISRWDPEANTEVLDWTKSFAKGILDTVGDSSSWEEFTIGALTGAMGMPTFRSTRTEDGKWRSPITIEGGLFNDYNEYKANKDKEESMVNALNSRIESPEFQNYYEGMIRHTKYQNDMNEAAENKDAFAYKNAEDSQLISDIIMFDKAGRLNDLIEMINDATELSDENIQSIIENTTDANGNGPFSQNGNALPKEEVIKKINERKDNILKQIESYRRIKEDINTKIGDKIKDSQLEELTWLKAKGNRNAERIDELSKEITPTIKAIAAVIEQENPEESNVVEGMRMLADADALTMGIILKQQPEVVQGLKEAASKLDNIYHLNYTDNINKIDDIISLFDSLQEFETKFKEYSENPIKQSQDKAKAKEKSANINEASESIKKKDNIVSKSVSEINEAIDNGDFTEDDLLGMFPDGLPDSSEIEEASEAESKVKTALDIRDKASRIKSEIDKSDLDDATKNNAKKLIDSSKSISDSLDDLTDLSSEAFNDPSLMFDDLDPSLQGLDTESLQDELEIRLGGAKDLLSEVISIVNDNEGKLDEMPKNISEGVKESSVESTGHDSVDKNEPINKPEPKKTLRSSLADNLIRRAKDETDNGPEVITLRDVIKDIDRLVNAGAIEKTIKKIIYNSESYKKAIKGFPGLAQSIEDYISDKLAERESNVTKSKEVKKDSYNPNMEDDSVTFSSATPKELEAESNKEAQGLDKQDGFGGIYTSWSSTLTRYYRYNPKWDRTLFVEVAEKRKYSPEELKRIKAIWNYLNNHNAFNFIDNNGVKEGDKITFTTNDTLNEEAGELVIIMEKEGDVIGVLPSPNDSNFNRYAGLSEFIKLFTEEYNKYKKSGKSEKFISKYTTSINKNMVGRVPYSKAYRTLNNIFTDSKSSGGSKDIPFELGISSGDGRNAKIIISGERKGTSTSTKRKQQTVLSPLDAKKGQPYLLIKTSDPKRAYVNVPFIMPQYSQDTTDSALGKAIDSVLNSLVGLQAKDIMKVKREIQELLAIPELHINILKNGNLKIDAKFQGDNKQTNIYNGKSDNPNLIQDIKSKLYGTPFQVSRKYINDTYKGQDYNRMIGELAFTNIDGTHTIDDWFTINPIDKDGKEFKGKTQKSTRNNPNSAKPKFFEYTWKGIPLKVDLDTFEVTRTDNNSKPEGSNVDKVKALAYGFKTSKSGTYQTSWGWFNSETLEFVDKPKQENVIKKTLKLEGTETEEKPKVPTKNDTPVIKFRRENNKGVFQDFTMRIKSKTTDKDGNTTVKFTGERLDSRDPEKPRTIENGYIPLSLDSIDWKFYVSSGTTLENGKIMTSEDVTDEDIEDAKETIISITTNPITGKVSTLHITKLIYTSNGEVFASVRELEGQNVKLILDPLNQNELFSSKENTPSRPEANNTFATPEELEEQARKKGLISSPKRKSMWKALDMSQQEAILNIKGLKQEQTMKGLELAYDVKTNKFNMSKLKGSIENYLGVKPLYRRVTESKEQIRDKEIKWLSKTLPNLSEEGRLKVVNGLIEISARDGGGFAWGQFKQGIIEISNQAARGTVYHEAFHAVTHTLLDASEYEELFKAGREKYGNLSDEAIEENLAEDFRRYMQLEEIPFVGRVVKIFRTLKHIVQNLLGKETYLNKVYYNINNAKFANREVQEADVVRNLELTPTRFQEIVDSVVNNATHTIKGRNNEWGKFVDSWKEDGVEVKGYRGSNNRYIVTSVNDMSEQSYYRRVEQYHREKLMYGNLSNEDKQYLSDRGISINEYNRMSQFEREVLFHCK